jgi:hypothetical protein
MVAWRDEEFLSLAVPNLTSLFPIQDNLLAGSLRIPNLELVRLQASEHPTNFPAGGAPWPPAAKAISCSFLLFSWAMMAMPVGNETSPLM